MAAKFKIAGAGNWNDDTQWSTTSGGANDTTKPTAGDDVFLDASSGNCTINATAVCRSINCTGYTGTLTHGAFNCSIGDATAGAGNIALKFVAGMTYTPSHATASAFIFVSTSATVQTVDFAGKTSGNVTFNATSNGSWQYTGQHVTDATATVQLTKGTLDINGQTCSWGLFSSSNTNTRTLTLGAANITITGSNARVWDLSVTGNLTFNYDTSTLTFSGTQTTTSTFIAVGANKTYYDIVLTGAGTGPMFGFGPFTCRNLTITGTAAKTNSYSPSEGLTCTGTFTANGNSATNRILIHSSTVGTARTITAATVAVTNADFMDITGAGAGSWDLSAVTGGSGDCGGNSGITFTTPATQTATMSVDKNWSDATIWTSRVPLPQDDVSLASVTGGILTADMPRLGRSIDWTGATGSPTWSLSIASTIYGSVTLISGMTISGTTELTLASRATHTITSAGKTFSMGFVINAPGTYTLSDAVTVAADKRIVVGNGGTFNSGNFSITTGSLIGVASSNNTWILGTSTVTLTGTSGVVISLISGASTFNNPDSTIVISSSSSSARTFTGGAKTFGPLTYTVAGSTGKLTITGSNSFSAINFSDANNARTLEFTSGVTTTIRNANGFNVVGTANKLMTVTSSAAGIHTLTSPNQQVFDYVNVSKTTADLTPKWYAGSHSTDGGTNTNIIFTDVPATSTGAGLSITSGDYEVYERAEYQQNLNSSLSSLNDLRRLYFASKGYTYLSVNDNVRAFLVEQTGLSASHSINDLWRAYAVKQGVTNQVSLSDMLKTLFNSIGLP